MSFSPNHEATLNIDVTAVSQRIELFPESGPIDVRVLNNGSATVWIAFGDDTVAATLENSMPIPAGKSEVFSAVNLGNGPLFVAAIAAATPGKIYFTTGRDR